MRPRRNPAPQRGRTPVIDRATRGAAVLHVGLVLALGAACSTDLPAPPAFDDPDAASDDPAPHLGAVAVRRLTRAQYVRTIADLFGDALPDDLQLVDALPVDDDDGGFAANTVAVTETVLVQYEDVAWRVAEAVRRDALHPCLAETIPTAECAQAFLAAFAPRALRRPVSTEELGELAAILGPPAVDADGGDASVRRLVAAILQSPDFLYRIERGEGDPDGEVVLRGHEIAARLSYLLWGTMPDDALSADAAAGRLHDPGYRRIVVGRMLADGRAAAGLAAMHRQWLELDALRHLVKDRNVFPTFSEALGPELDAELVDTVALAILHADGELSTLLTANTAVATVAVTSWYGDEVVASAPAPASFGEGRALLELDPTRRAGVLTLRSVLAAHAKPDRSDPVRRGALVRERLLCQPLAAPPPGAAMPPAAPAPGASLRERLELHGADPSCATCHAQIDPIGFLLEGYDAMGGTRTHDEAGNPIDTRGRVSDSDLDAALDGGVALAWALADSEQVQRCYVRQWFRYAFGRLEVHDDDDDAFIDALERRFVADGGHIPTLLGELVGSDAFVHRRANP